LKKYLFLLLVLIFQIVFLYGCVSEFTVTFDSRGGNHIDEITGISKGSTIDLPIPKRLGYEFIGWFVDATENAEQFYKTSKVEKDIKLYAKWEEATYVVTFLDYDGTILNKQEVKHGLSAIAPNKPTRDGYQFIGWDNIFIEVFRDLTITAIYYSNLDYNFLTDAMESIAYNDLSNLKEDIFLENFTPKNNLPIVWELDNNDGTLDLILDDENNKVIKVIPNEFSVDENGVQNNEWGYGKLRATITYKGLSLNKEWELHVMPEGRNKDYNILSINDLKNKATTITFKVRQGVISDALVALVNEFEKEFPYIQVKIAPYAGSYDMLRSSTILDINLKNEDKIPDLIIGYPEDFAEYYVGNNLVNLQYFIDDLEVGMDEDEMNDFIQAYLLENRGFDPKFPNDLYSLPLNKTTEVMVYNKTAFQALFGSNYLNKIPKTWEEMNIVSAEIINKVKAGELDNTFVDTYDYYTGTTTYIKVSDYLNNQNNPRFIPFIYESPDNGFITLTKQFGAKYTKRESVLKGYIYFDNAEARSAMTYFQTMKNYGVFGVSSNLDVPYSSDAFKLIQTLMTVGSASGIAYNASTKYELGFAPIPYYNEDAKYVIQQGTNIGMLNHNNDEEKLASWLFIKYLMRPENTAQFAMATGGYLPVKESAYESDKYSQYLKNPTNDKKEFSAAAKVAFEYYIKNEYEFIVDEAFIGSSSIRKETGRLFNSIIADNGVIVNKFKEAYENLKTFLPEDE